MRDGDRPTLATADEAASRAAFESDAFISYSRVDKAFASALEKALERFKPPRDLEVPQRHLKVFRDEQDITGVDYGKAVRKHLQSARSLIVLCSPAARASEYVDEEIREFAGARGAEHLIPVLVGGIPNNEAGEERAAEKAFPEALCELLGMPLAASYLGFDAGRHKVDRGEFFNSWSTILANLYGVSRDELEQRERRRRARRRRIAIAVVGAIMAALSVALVVTLISRQEAVEQRGIAQAKEAEAVEARDRAERAAEAERLAREQEAAQRALAEERRREAEEQREIARAEAVAARRETANRLAIQALEKLYAAPEEALRLAVRSVETYYTAGDPTVPRALEALIKTTTSFGGGRPAAPWPRASESLVFSDDLAWVATSDEEGVVRFASAVESEAIVLEPPGDALDDGEAWDDEPTALTFSAARLFAARPIDENERGLALWYWDLDDGGVANAARLIARVPTSYWPGFDFELMASPDGHWLSYRDLDNAYLRAVDPAAGHAEFRLMGWPKDPLRAFSSDSRRFALAQVWSVHWWALEPPRPEAGAGPEAREMAALETEGRSRAALAITQRERTLDGEPEPAPVRRLALLGRTGELELWDLEASPPVVEELPSLLEPFAESLEVFAPEPDKVGVRLTYGRWVHGLLAEITDAGGEWGVAAVHLLEREPAGWRPLHHRNLSIRGVSRTTRASGSMVTSGGAIESSSASGFRLKDPEQVGVAGSAWVGGLFPVTVGLDGTLRYHDLDEGTSARVAESVSSVAADDHGIASLLLVGHRNGKLSVVDMDGDAEDPPLFLLSAHDGPVAQVVQNPEQTRFVTFDGHGGSRIWDRRHPPLTTDELDRGHPPDVAVRLTPDWRWLVASDGQGWQEIWDLGAVDPLARPVSLAAAETREIADAAREPESSRPWKAGEWEGVGESRSFVTRAPGRPALHVDGGSLWWLDESSGAEDPWLELLPGHDLEDAVWDETGEALALGDGAGRVWVTRPPRGAGPDRLAAHLLRALEGESLPMAWSPVARGAIERLVLLSGPGWLVAGSEMTDDSGDAALFWFRTPRGAWEEPLVFGARELLLPYGFYASGVSFRPDGRQALVEGQFVTFEPRQLLAMARALLPAAPAPVGGE